MTAWPGRHEQPTRGPQAPGVACPADAKGNMAYTHDPHKSARRLSLAPVHRPFTTAEPARQPLLGTMRDRSIRLRAALPRLVTGVRADGYRRVAGYLYAQPRQGSKIPLVFPRA
jgi:hypothetical protein